MKRLLPQVKHDETYSPLLLVASNPQIEAWRSAADRAGLTLREWCVDRLGRAATTEVA